MFARTTLTRLATALAFSFTLLLTGCDLAELLADPKIAQKEADAKAIGGACRHGLRSIEDCYTLNKGVNKAAIYAGWREMDEYMRENKLEGLRAEIPLPAPAAPPATPAEEIIDEAKPKAKPKAAAH